LATNGEIESWLNEHANGPAKLARSVSLAAIVEAEFLRAARLKFYPELGVESEGDVWFSPLIESRSSSGAIFSKDAVQKLWSDFTEREILDEIRALTREYRSGVPPAIEAEEEMAYWSLANKPESQHEIDKLLAQVLTTMLSPEHGYLATWAQRAVPRLETVTPTGERLTLLKQAAWERGVRVANANPGAAPEWLKPRGTQTTTFGARLFGRSLELSQPPITGSHTMTVLGRLPLSVLVSADSDFQGAREIVVEANKVATVPIAITEILYLRTAGGGTWTVEPLKGSRPRVLLGASSVSGSALLDEVQADLGKRGFHLGVEDGDGYDAFVFVVDSPVSSLESFPAYANSEKECRQMILLCAPGVLTAQIPKSSAHTLVDFTDRTQWRQALAELSFVLTTSETRPAELFAVPKLPEKYVPRPAELESLRSTLPVATANRNYVAFSGQEGSGRRTLAIAIARDCAIRKHFRNGVQWLSARPATITPTSGQLIICDYDADDADFASWLSQGAGVLLTRTIPRDAPTYTISPLDSQSTGQLWRNYGRVSRSFAGQGLDEAFLPLEGGAAISPIVQLGNPLAITALSVLINLHGIGLVDKHLSALVATQQPGDLPRLMFRLIKEMNSLAAVFPSIRPDFDQSLAFAPEVFVPGTLWTRVDGVTKEAVTSLAQLQIITVSEEGAYRIRKTAVEELAPQISPQHHVRIVEAYRSAGGGDWASGAPDGYYHDWLVWHMMQAGLNEEAKEVIVDYDWIVDSARSTGMAGIVRQMRRVDSLWTDGRESSIFHDLLGILSVRISDPNEIGATLDSLPLSRSVLRNVSSSGWGPLERLFNRARKRTLLRSGNPEQFVLVAGLGGSQIPMSVVYASEVLGRELARGGYGLRSGGWPGVDHIVCREYVHQLRRDGTLSQNALIHVIPENTTPDLWAAAEMKEEGRLEFSPAREETYRSVADATAVVLVGGVQGTRDVYDAARKMGKPVFGVRGTGGVADEAAEMPSDAESEADKPVPVINVRTARTAVMRVIQDLERIPPVQGLEGVPA
jgi:hypothetical protein